MSRPPILSSRPVPIGIVGLAAVGLALAGFETGRHSVDAEAIARKFAREQSQPSSIPQRSHELISAREPTQVIIRDIATVPFSELYDVLKAASREQLLAWARDLESMPRGPHQRAAVNAYYKSLVQVDHRAAIEAVLSSNNLIARDVAVDAIMRAAPESIWAEVGEMIGQMQFPARGFAQDNLVSNWSRVDPVEASHFVEKHRFSPSVKFPGEESDRAISLLNNWGEIDPNAARKWLEADVSRQTWKTVRAFLSSWGQVDRAAAIDYAIANAQRPNFQPAINELVHDCVRSAKEDATKLILLLPPDQAQDALRNVADITNPHEVDSSIELPPNYRQPVDQVARWMVTLPFELWKESIGRVAEGWLKEDNESAKGWLAQLQPEQRDATIVSLFREARAHQIPTGDVLEVGLTVSDRKLRDTLLVDFLRVFGPNTTEVLQALDEFSLPAEKKDYLRKIVMENDNVR